MTPVIGAPPPMALTDFAALVRGLSLELERMITPPIDSLINQLVPLNTVGKASAAMPAVIEAVVLSNSPLMNNSGQYQITLSNNQQQYQVTTQTPIPVGATVQLRITQNNLAVVLDIIADKSSGQPSTATAQQATTANAKSAATAPPPLSNISIKQTDAIANSALALLSTQQFANRQLIDQTIRQTLPQQQSLHSLIPVIQTVLQSQDALPKSLTNTLKFFLQQIPTSEQMQTAKPLKKAMQNSGVFFESKLAHRVERDAKTRTTPLIKTQTQNPATTPKNAEIVQDTKGLIIRLLNQIQRAQTDLTTSSATVNTSTDPTMDAESVLPTTITQQPLLKHSTTPEHSKQQNIDVVLRQLSQHLLATLARTQLHQMESLGHRQPVTGDSQAALNSWHVELPIVHGQHIDNLKLVIEEREAQASAGSPEKRSKQWQVMLNFDLHQLGKMQVQLSIVERSVSAMVWSQQRETHEQVKKHIDELQNNLEKVGVNVIKVECQLGAPPKQESPLYRQLVDVRT